MARYMVRTNVTDEKTIEANNPQEAAALYHQSVGDTMPKDWDGVLHLRDEHGEEWTYRRRAAA